MRLSIASLVFSILLIGLLFFSNEIYVKAASVTEEELKNILEHDANNAFIIDSEDDLKLFRQALIDGTYQYEGELVLLNTDIELTEPLVAIPKKKGIFLGYFDGQGHAITSKVKQGVSFIRQIGNGGVIANTQFHYDIEGIKSNNDFWYIGEVGISSADSNAKVVNCSFKGTLFTGEDIKFTYAKYPTPIYTVLGEISNCSFNVNIECELKPTNIFGIAYTNKGSIKNCVIYNKINLNGFACDKDIYPVSKNVTSGTVENCFFLKDSDIQYNEGNGGTPCTADQMKQQSTFTGLDFDHIWTMDEKAGHPVLRAKIDEEYLPTKPNVTKIPVTYKLTAEDVTYENNDFEKFVPLTVSLPEYTGTEETIQLKDGSTLNVKDQEALKKFLTDTCGLQITERDKGNENSIIMQARTVIPTKGYTIEFLQEPSYFVTISTKKSAETGYKVDITLKWGDKTSTFIADDVKDTELSEQEKAEKLGLAYDTMRKIIDDYRSEFADEAYGDNWVAYTCARCGYYPDGWTKESLYEGIAARYSAYWGLSYDEIVAKRQQEGANEFLTNTLSKDILAITALGYDSTNVHGVNLIELYSYASDSSTFAGQYVMYALYSGRYADDAEIMSMAKVSAGDMLTRDNEQYLAGTIPDDMRVMGMQPVFLLKDEPGGAEAIKAIADWLARMQTVEGNFPGTLGYRNAWTNAQVEMLMGLCNIDWLDARFVKNGRTIADVAYELAHASLDYNSDRLQGARGIAALIISEETDGQYNLFDCTNVIGARTVNRLIEGFEDDGVLTIADHQEEIEEARRIYNEELTDSQREAVFLDKLEAAEKKLVLKLTADEFAGKMEALKAGEGQLLLANVADGTVADIKAETEELKAQLGNMAEDVAAVLNEMGHEDYEAALNGYLKQIADLEEAYKVLVKLQAIPDEVTVDDQMTIESARSAYNALTEGQRGILNEQAAAEVQKLGRSETALNNARLEAMKANIGQFADMSGIGTGDEQNLLDIRGMYNALPDSIKAELETEKPEGNESTYKQILDKALDAMKGMKLDELKAQIEALRDESELETGEDGELIYEITEEDIAAIGAAQAAYEHILEQYGLTDEEAQAEGTKKALEKLEAVNKIAKDFTGYVDAYLGNMLETLAGTDAAELDDTNLEAIEDALAKYDAHHEAYGAYLDSIEGLSGQVEALQSAAEALRADIDAANEVYERIEALPLEIGSVQEGEAFEAALKELDAMYDALTDRAKTYVGNYDRRNAAAEAYNLYLELRSYAAGVDEEIGNALALAEEGITNKTVAAVKAAQESYDWETKDIQALVERKKELESLEKQIVEEKLAAIRENGVVTVQGGLNGISYDVVVEIEPLYADQAAYQKDVLWADKEAEMVSAFELNAYRVYADGSTQLWNPYLTASLPAGVDLKGKEAYVVQTSANDQENYYLAATPSTATGNVSFLMDTGGVYALGVKEVPAADGGDGSTGGSGSTGNDNNSGSNNSGNNNNNGNTGNAGNNGAGTTNNYYYNNYYGNSGSGSSASTGTTASTSTKTASTAGSATASAGSTATRTASTGSTVTIEDEETPLAGSSGNVVPRTGDTIPLETALGALIALAGAAALYALNKKRRAM